MTNDTGSQWILPGDVIFKEGEFGHCAYVIEAGRIEITVHDPDKGDIRLAVLEPGDVFGEMAVIDNGKRTATACAIEPTKLLEISAKAVRDRIAEADPVVSVILDMLLARYRSLRNTAEDDGQQNMVSRHDLDQERRRHEIIRRLRMANELRAALAHNQLELRYQPITHFQSGSLVGFEALVRWNHPEKGPIPPDEFISDAEDNGLIVDIGYWVLKEACLAQRRMGRSDLFMSVNVSAKQLDDPLFAARVREILDATALTPSQLKLEVTESVLMRDPDAFSVLNELKAIGVSIAIDDFGTGYSSLGCLHRIPADTLKIDRTLTAEVCVSHKGRKVMEAITAMASRLDLKVVAEGVETIDQWAAMRDMGLDYEQGYRVSAPLPERQARVLASAKAGAPVHVEKVADGMAHKARTADPLLSLKAYFRDRLGS